MATITAHKCDRCDCAVQEKREFFHCVIGVESELPYYGAYYPITPVSKRHMIDLCGRCAVELGLAKVEVFPAANPPPTELSFEQLLREIVRDEVAKCVESS